MLNRFENFTALISEITRCVQKIEKDEMEKYGYRGAFAHYLLILSRFPQGLSLSELCEKSDRDKAAVSRILSEMTEKELVKRSQEAKAYRAKFSLTPAGQQAAGYVRSKAQRAVDAVGRALSDEEREYLYRSLSIIADQLQILSKEGIPPEGDNNGQDNS